MPSSYAFHRSVENAWLVRERDRRRRRDHLRVLLWALPLAAVLLAYTWLHVQLLDTAYRIVELEAQQERLDQRRAELTLEVARRSALPEVEARAADELGMVPPAAARTLFWEQLAPSPTAGGTP